MKLRTAWIVLIVVVLAGCSLLGLSNPFVGSWTGDAFGAVTYTFNSDMSFSESGEGIFGDEYTDTGTYEYTDERLTLTYADDDEIVMLYEFRDGLLVLDAISGMSMSLVLTPVE